MFIDVLEEVAQETGLDKVNQRNTLTVLLNRAVRSMYPRLEANKLQWEVTLEVPPNKIITLPSYIGELRGMRETITEGTFDLKGMTQPRYTRKDWSYKWHNWRDLGEMPVMLNPSVVAPLTISTSEVDKPITVYISGQSNRALRTEEQVVLNDDNLTVRTSTLFGPQIYTIACRDDRPADITITDDTGQVLAMLYTMDKESRYKIIDVSQAPWSIDTASNNSLVDVLYKVLMRKLTKDSDQFPAGSDYDVAWYYWALYLYYKPMQNRPPEYETFLGNALAEMKSVKDSSEGFIDKRIQFGRNRFYGKTRKPHGFYPYYPYQVNVP